jgi:hypothetical protein
MREWLPDGHLGWFVLDVVASCIWMRCVPGIALAVPGARRMTRRCCSGCWCMRMRWGNARRGGSSGVCSTDVAFRVLCAQGAPDRTTIARVPPRRYGSVPAGVLPASGVVRAGRDRAVGHGRDRRDEDRRERLDRRRSSRGVVLGAGEEDHRRGRGGRRGRTPSSVPMPGVMSCQRSWRIRRLARSGSTSRARCASAFAAPATASGGAPPPLSRGHTLDTGNRSPVQLPPPADPVQHCQPEFRGGHATQQCADAVATGRNKQTGAAGAAEHVRRSQPLPAVSCRRCPTAGPCTPGADNANPMKYGLREVAMGLSRENCPASRQRMSTLPSGFRSRRKADHVTLRLIVRRVKDKNRCRRTNTTANTRSSNKSTPTERQRTGKHAVGIIHRERRLRTGRDRPQPHPRRRMPGKPVPCQGTHRHHPPPLDQHPRADRPAINGASRCGYPPAGPTTAASTACSPPPTPETLHWKSWTDQPNPHARNQPPRPTTPKYNPKRPAAGCAAHAAWPDRSRRSIENTNLSDGCPGPGPQLPGTAGAGQRAGGARSASTCAVSRTTITDASSLHAWELLSTTDPVAKGPARVAAVVVQNVHMRQSVGCHHGHRHHERTGAGHRSRDLARPCSCARCRRAPRASDHPSHLSCSPPASDQPQTRWRASQYSCWSSVGVGNRAIPPDRRRC